MIEPEYSTFAEHVGEHFTVEVEPGRTCELEVVGVAGAPPDPSVDHTFSVMFHGPAHQPIPQGTYPFSHPTCGAFALFIVPVGREADVFVYEAVFTQLATP
jgi:hypothetical protein